MKTKLTFLKTIRKFQVLVKLSLVKLSLVFVIWVALGVVPGGGDNLWARKLYYLEEFYKLYYHPHRPESQDYLRNIHWLRFALKRPFAPPLYALKPPENEEEYNRYRKLLVMHIRYLIVKNTVYLGARFDKFKPVFYNKPYREDILKSLDIAEYLYRQALIDWSKVKEGYQNLLNTERKGNRVKLEFLETMVYRMRIDDLNYNRIIDRRLDAIAEQKEYFKKPTTESVND